MTSFGDGVRWMWQMVVEVRACRGARGPSATAYSLVGWDHAYRNSLSRWWQVASDTVTINQPTAWQNPE